MKMTTAILAAMGILTPVVGLAARFHSLIYDASPSRPAFAARSSQAAVPGPRGALIYEPFNGGPGPIGGQCTIHIYNSLYDGLFQLGPKAPAATNN